jgi:hypothetical protein
MEDYGKEVFYIPMKKETFTPYTNFWIYVHGILLVTIGIATILKVLTFKTEWNTILFQF